MSWVSSRMKNAFVVVVDPLAGILAPSTPIPPTCARQLARVSIGYSLGEIRDPEGQANLTMELSASHVCLGTLYPFHESLGDSSPSRSGTVRRLGGQTGAGPDNTNQE